MHAHAVCVHVHAAHMCVRVCDPTIVNHLMLLLKGMYERFSGLVLYRIIVSVLLIL